MFQPFLRFYHRLAVANNLRYATPVSTLLEILLTYSGRRYQVDLDRMFQPFLRFYRQENGEHPFRYGDMVSTLLEILRNMSPDAPAAAAGVGFNPS